MKPIKNLKSKKLFLLSLTSLWACILNAQVPAGAVGDWPFDNNALDVSGNGNNGIASAVTPAPDRFNQPNKAYRFNGTSSKVYVPHNSSVDVGTGIDFSFAFWMKSYSSTQTAALLSKHVSGTWNGYSFVANNQSDPGYCTAYDHIFYYVASGAQQDACSNNPILADTLWHFIVGAYDATNNYSYLYIDNVLQTDIGQSSGPVSNPANLSFGYDDNTNNGFFNGVLDGAKLYKRVLTAAEVSQLFNESCAVPNPVNATPSSNNLICNSQTATLSVTSTGTINWYTSAASTVIVGTGSSFSTPTLTTGIYIYYAATTTTCGSSARTAITVTVNACTGINQPDKVVNIVIYPNPNNGTFVLKANSKPVNAEAIIINQLGEEVFKMRIEDFETNINTTLPRGIYFLKVNSASKTLILQKMIISE